MLVVPKQMLDFICQTSANVRFLTPSAAKTAAVQSTAQISSERTNKNVLRIKGILLVNGDHMPPIVYYI